MERLKELKEKIEKVEITYDYWGTYTTLNNIVIDYMNESQNFEFEYLFENIIDYELAEDRAKWELEQGGLIRLYYFLGNINANDDLFVINGYGNLEDLEIEDLKTLKENILNDIELKLKSEQ